MKPCTTAHHPSMRLSTPLPDDSLWYKVLLRPPTTWSAAEVASWAHTGPERFGAGLPWLAATLERNCIGEQGIQFCKSSQIKLACA